LTTLVLDVPLKTVSVVCLEPVAGYWLIWLLTTSICYCQLDSAQSPKSHDIPSGDRQTELDQAVGLLRVEVLARVPKDYKRPYQLVRMKPGDRINHLAAIWSDEDQRV
jgi:hypothetical protein